MNGLHFQRMILSGTLILTLGACVHKPTKTVKADVPMQIAAPMPQQEVLLQEARTEAENLRGELASLKILMAKQMGELKSLREQSQRIQNREHDQGNELQDIRSQLLSSQAERDQLRKRNVELEGQVSNLPDTSQLVSDIQTLTGSFHKIMNNMKNLASDMRLIKQEMNIPTGKPKPRQTKLMPNVPPVPATGHQTPDAKGRIIIQEGDTLWHLARTYDVSIEQLREWNNIYSDLIMTGFSLKVAQPMETGHPPVEQVNVIPDPLGTMPQVVVQETPPQVVSTPEPPSPEPTHILSIGTPQPDSNELP